MRKISKKQLISLIKEDVDVHKSHISSVVNILIEEFIKELIEVKSIKIINFCIFKIQKISGRKIININSGKEGRTSDANALRIKLSKEFAKYFMKNRKV